MMTRSKATNKNAKKETMREKIQRIEIQNINLTQQIAEKDLNLETLLSKNLALRRQNSELDTKVKSLLENFEKQRLLKSKIDQEKEVFDNTTKNLEKKLSISKEVEKSHSAVIQKITEQNETLNKKANELEKTIEETSSLLSKKDEEVKELSAKLNVFETRSENLKSSIVRLEKKQKSYSENVKNKEEELTNKINELEEENRATVKELRKTQKDLSAKTECVDKLENENKEFNNKFMEMSEEHKNLGTDLRERLNKMEAEQSVKNEQIKLLKAAGENYEAHIESLKDEIVSYEEKLLQTNKSLEEKSEELTRIKGYVEQEKKRGSFESYLASSIRETIKLLHSEIDCRSAMGFDVNPGMAPEELYMKCSSFYDAYKCAFKEKTALENGLRKFASYVEEKSPALQKQQAKFEMLQQAYSSLAKKLSEVKKELYSVETEKQSLQESLRKQGAKKNAHKKNVSVLKTQLQNFMREQSEGNEAKEGFAFSDYKSLHDKFMALLKRHNEEHKMHKHFAQKSKEEKNALIKEFGDTKRKWMERENKLREEIGNLSHYTLEERKETFVSYRKTQSPSSESLVGIKRENRRYENLLEETTKSISEIQKDSFTSISAAQKRTREAEKLLAIAKSGATRAVSELGHAKRMKKMSEEDLRRKTKELDLVRVDLNVAKENINEQDEKIASYKLRLEKTKSSERALEAQLEYLKGSIQTLQKSEERALKLLEEAKELNTIQNGKIERLEQTVRELESEERSKIAALQTEKRRLEETWTDLHNARELDLKSGREALESSNNLARKALEELQREKSAKEDVLKEKNELSARLENLLSGKERMEKEILQLQRHKRISNSVLMEVSGDINPNQTKKRIPAEKIFFYEKEIEDLRSQKNNLNKLYRTNSTLLKNLKKKSEETEKRLKEELKETNEKQIRTSDRLHKVTKTLQESILKNANLQKEMEGLKAKETEWRETESNLVQSVKNIEEKRIEEISLMKSEVETERRNAMKMAEKYENEISRHGETVKKLQELQKGVNSSNLETDILKTKLGSTLKLLETAQKGVLESKESNARAEKEREKVVKELEGKVKILCTELNSTNILNRYLREKQGINNFPISDAQKNAEELESKSTGDKNDVQKSLENYQALLNSVQNERNRLEIELESERRKSARMAFEVESLSLQLEKAKDAQQKTLETLKRQSLTEEAMKDLERRAGVSTVMEENNRALREKIAEIRFERLSAEKELGELKNSIQPLRERIEELVTERKAKIALIESKDSMIRSWESRCLKIFEKENFVDPEDHQKVLKTLEEQTQKLKNAESKTNELETSNKRLEEENTKFEARLRSTENTLLKFKMKNVDSISKEREEMRNKQREIVTQQITLRAENTRLGRALFEKKEEAVKSEEKCRSLEGEIEKLKMITNKMQETIKEERETSEIYRRNAQEASSRVIKIQKELDAVSKNKEKEEKEKKETEEKGDKEEVEKEEEIEI